MKVKVQKLLAASGIEIVKFSVDWDYTVAPPEITKSKARIIMRTAIDGYVGHRSFNVYESPEFDVVAALVVIGESQIPVSGYVIKPARL